MLRHSLAVIAAATVLVTLLTSSAPAARPQADFPVTVTAANGKVRIPHRPRRIVSLSPTATETLFAVNAGAQVVAVDDQSDYPTAAPRTKLSGFTPNAEAVAKYRPDLVILSYDANSIVASLKKLVLYVGTQDGHVVALDAADGSRLWSVSVGGPVSGSIAFANEILKYTMVLYVATTDGSLSSLNGASGKLR